MTTADAWKIRHCAALHDPSSYMERGITGSMRSICDLVEGIGGTTGWPDAVGTPAIAQMLAGLRTILNFTVDRLDAGSVDSWICLTAEMVGWDLDLERIIWPE